MMCATEFIWSLSNMLVLCRVLKYSIFICVIFSWYHGSMAVHSRYYLKWIRFDCANDLPHFVNIDCRIEPQNEQKISVDMIIAKQINVLWIKVAFLLLRPLQNTYTTFMEGDLNACQFIKADRLDNKLFDQVYRSMLKYSNQPRQCPVNVGPLYYHNISALDNLPAFLPEMDFIINITYYMPKIPKSFNMTFNGKLMELRRVGQKG